MDRTPSLLLNQKQALSKTQREYRVVGIAMFVIAAGLLGVRMITNLLFQAGMTEDWALDLFFTVMIQVVVLTVAPFLLYWLVLKKSPKQVLEFSNVKKTKWYNCALAVPLGFIGLFITIGISGTWFLIITLFGYIRPGVSSPLPAEPNYGLFFLQLFLTGVLPGICEEFAMRGGLLSVTKKSYTFVFVYIIMGVAFGLFHQNIEQVFYTAIFGVVMAYLAIVTKSIWPCIIVHFINNAFSVYLSHAAAYGWFLGNLFDWIATTNFLIIFLLFFACIVVYVGILAAIYFLNSGKLLKKKKDVILSSGFDLTNKRVIMVGNSAEIDSEKVAELGLEKEVFGEKQQRSLYKPTLRDNAFYIGAIAIAAVFTMFSFIWGLI